MAQAKLYNAQGKEQGTVDLNDAVFGVPTNQSLVHQVFVALRANARQAWAHAKDKSEIRGGGRKPWKQKGTGRARHGSIRSPLWRGGGATFGPLKNRNYSQKINKKMNRSAVRMTLSAKLQTEKFVVIESFDTKGKTSSLASTRNGLPGLYKTTLLVTDGKNEEVMQAAANMKKTDVKRANDLSVMDLLNHQYIVASKSAAEALEKRLA